MGKRIVKRLETSGILSGDRMFICGTSKTFDILRISGGTSPASANDKCHRIGRFCFGQVTNVRGAKISVSEKRHAFGLQNIGKLRKKVADDQPSGKTERSKITKNGELKIQGNEVRTRNTIEPVCN